MKLLLDTSIFLITFFIFFAPSAARDTITPSQPLADNETLISSGGQFALGFFTPPNSRMRYIGIWFNKIADQTAVWVANRASPVIDSTGHMSITANGTLMITDKKWSIIWSIDTTSGSNVSTAQLLDNGNFVLKQDGNTTQSYAWQSFDYPTDTLLAGMKLGLDRTTGFSRNLTAWKSDTDPSEGEYYEVMDINTNLYLYSRSGKIWRPSLWNGSYLKRKGFKYSYVNSSQELAFYFQASEPPTKYMVSQSGKVQWLTWMPDSSRWDISLEEPATQCDIYGYCGPNAICDINSSSMCNCLQGFRPKNLSKWASADWTDGCIRKTRLDCRNETDGFVTITPANLPDSEISFKYNDFTLEECRLMCLNNCSCTAYAMYTWDAGCVIWVTDWLLDIVQMDGFQEELYLRIASADIAMTCEGAGLLSGVHKPGKSWNSGVKGARHLCRYTSTIGSCEIENSLSITQSYKKKTVMVIIVVTLLLGSAVLICLALFLRKRRRNGSKFFILKSDENDEELDIPLFDFRTIEAATKDFNDENKLGQGGFGIVYKGKLANEQEIAVKRLGTSSLQGTDEFKNEVKIIAKLQNRNLVRLLGCCIQGEERMLIYEYMPNKSLDFFLFDKEKGATLDWQTRYQIIIGIARGLLYLHHDSRFRIIHRDLKASNILLDEEMNPKISDFGMARLFDGNGTDFKTRKVVGTYGYMSPEYAMGGIFSLKSDVYSYGVLILEIISGKKNSGAYTFFPYINLVAHAWSLWNEGKALELVEESMSDSVSMNDVLRCVKVGLLCVQEHPGDRPLMSSVIMMLGTEISSLPEPKQPGFVAIASSLELDKSSKQDSPASNDLTITLFAR